MLSLFSGPECEVEWLSQILGKEDRMPDLFLLNQQILLLITVVIFGFPVYNFHIFDQMSFTELFQQFLDRSSGSSYKTVT